MQAARRPAVATICATLPDGGRGIASSLMAGRGAALTWCLRGNAAGSVAEAVDDGGRGCALLVDDTLAGSRAALRRAVGEVRAALPALEAVVLRGATPLEHHDLLAAAGIRVAVVEAFGPAVRGSRRPAPAGWSCRSVVWGLWEVQLTSAVRRGWRRLLPAGWARPRAGSLQVIHDDVAGLTPTVSRWLERGRSGTVETVLLADLPAVLGNQGRVAAGGSVLKAA